MKKKFFASLILFLSLSISSFAEESPTNITEDSSVKSNGWWPILQIVIFPGFPPYTDMDVYGIRTGFPVSGGTGAVDGAEITPFISYSDYVYGIQIAPLMNHTKKTDGFRCSLINASTEKARGLQLGFLNMNFKDAAGFDIGIVNTTSDFMRGFQIGLWNYSSKNGMQIGLYNQTKKYGMQIGLINIIEEGYIPFLPVINFW